MTQRNASSPDTPQTFRTEYAPAPAQEQAGDASASGAPTTWLVAFQGNQSAYTGDVEIEIRDLVHTTGERVSATELLRHERHYPDWRERMRRTCREALRTGTATPAPAPEPVAA